MIKVLNLFTTLDNGGVESFLYNYYTHMDHNLFHFDFIVPGFHKGFLEDNFIQMGSKVYHVPTMHQNPLRQFYQIAQIIKYGNYDIVHCHGYKSILGLILGKLFGIKVRIIHSHMAYEKENKKQKIIKDIAVKVLEKYATVQLACGIDAARWLFGVRNLNNKKVKIINNAIDVHKFLFNSNKRDRIRKSFNISNSYVIGNVARLSYQKNQAFLLKLVKKLSLDIPQVKLLLVGNGEDEAELKKMVDKMGLSDKVLFLGIRKDIPGLLSAFDVFALPSRYEGLPVVLSEAQSSGLVSFVSDNVTREVQITNRLMYLPLDVDLWASKIHDIYREKEALLIQRVDTGMKMFGSKYDISLQATHLMDLYRKEVNR